MQKTIPAIVVIFILAFGAVGYSQQTHPLEDSEATSFVHPEQNESGINRKSQKDDPEYLSCQYKETTDRSFYNGNLWTGITYCGSSDGRSYKGRLTKILSKYEIVHFETHNKTVRLLLRKKR